MGSEMCIRDRNNPALAILFGIAFTALLQSSSSSTVIFQAFAIQGLLSYNCLLYTSDAADEEDSVDLGGRRIIHKKKRKIKKKKTKYKQKRKKKKNR